MAGGFWLSGDVAPRQAVFYTNLPAKRRGGTCTVKGLQHQLLYIPAAEPTVQADRKPGVSFCVNSRRAASSALNRPHRRGRDCQFALALSDHVWKPGTPDIGQVVEHTT